MKELLKESELIVAHGQNYEIGMHGKLPWNGDMSLDLRHFRHAIAGRSVVMGRNTYHDIGHPLSTAAETIVISRTQHFGQGIVTATSFEEACREAKYPIMFAGGDEVYRLALPFVRRAHVTEISASFPNADTFFTPLPPEYHEVSREHYDANGRNNRYACDFVTYEAQRIEVPEPEATVIAPPKLEQSRWQKFLHG